jgi:predicted transcriptional regulator
MKFRVEFEMKKHHCYYCPLCNGADLCNLLDEEDFDDLQEEQLNNCPLKIVDDKDEVKE